MDLQAQAQSRIAWQYRNSPKFQAWIDTLPVPAQTALEDPLQTLADLLEIDARNGELLDIIGRIVGIDRPPVIRDTEAAITSLGHPEPQLGGTGVQLSAAQYTVTEELSDEVFRVLIKARIEKNNGGATIDNIVRALRRIVDSGTITVNDNMDMTFSVTFSSELTSTVRFVLNNFDVLPRPAGVRFLGFIEEPGAVQLGAAFAVLGDERAQLNDLP